MTNNPGNQYQATFVGFNPVSPTGLTVPVYLIPVKMVYGNTSFTPLSQLPKNRGTVIQSIINSPIFQSNVKFYGGGVYLGTTQYINAFQRANLWSFVKPSNLSGPVNPWLHAYSVLLAPPTVLPEQTVNVPIIAGNVSMHYGTNVISADYQWFDNTIQPLISTLNIPSNALAIFVTTETFLLDNGQCCVGGYHNVTAAGVTYSHATYIQTVGAFAQDVSALSHEIGEWANDPFATSTSPCGLLENGDPLENFPNYGSYPYSVQGVVYNLQDLAMLPYFGQTGVTLNNMASFHGASLTVCQNGP